MKRVTHIILILVAISLPLHAQSDTLSFAPAEDESDSLEYELIVMDPGYETFLVSQLPMEYHTQQYYETWNQRYVREWNYRHDHPFEYGDNYETYIDYQPDIDYGLELNYRLYYYFRFYEKENGVDLLPEKVF